MTSLAAAPLPACLPTANPTGHLAHSCLPAAALWGNRLALFVVFFWFGALKVLGLSPAEALVTQLHARTLAAFIPAADFQLVLGLVECAIGLLWLVPGLTRYALLVFAGQMLAAFLPLLLLPDETWQRPLVLSLSGQYILKNVVLLASAGTIYADCRVRGWPVYR